MTDRIAKQRLNVILLVDCSTSMRGERISSVNHALRDIKDQLVSMEKENTNVDFYLTVITFSTDARLVNNDKMKKIDDFSFQDLKGAGWSNLHLGYEKLSELLAKEEKGGIMPDFGGVSPIILLMTDGHPTGDDFREKLKDLKKKPWFNQAIRYGIAIELNDQRTKDVLKDFVGENGDVLDCYDAKKLASMIKIIVVTASKVKSSTSNVAIGNNKTVSQKQAVRQQVAENLNETEDWEW